jgi:hypothetical protein
MVDWNIADRHLLKCEKVFAEIDLAGYLVLIFVISPLRDRLTKGERTKKLWNEIMDLSL